MPNTAKCQRCLLPVVGALYTLRLDSDPPQPDALAVFLCEGCVESMSRWLTRRNRPGEGFQPGATAPSDDVRVSGRRSSYAGAIDEFESAGRRKLIINIFLGTIVLAITAAVAIYAIVGTAQVKPRTAIDVIAPESP